MDLNNYSFTEFVGIFITGLCIVFLFSLLLALPILWLWNSTMPDLFGLKMIDWWTAWKLSMLCGFLFKTSVTASKKN